jgi:hypothetical protein
MGSSAMVEDAAAGLSNVAPSPEGLWGQTFGRRRVYNCSTCTSGRAVTNRELLRLILESIVVGQLEFSLGRP